jgi:hypothetical protein
LAGGGGGSVGDKKASIFYFIRAFDFIILSSFVYAKIKYR